MYVYLVNPINACFVFFMLSIVLVKKNSSIIYSIMHIKKKKEEQNLFNVEKKKYSFKRPDIILFFLMRIIKNIFKEKKPDLVTVNDRFLLH